MLKWFSRLRYFWRRHGPIGLVRLAAYNIAYHVRGRRQSIGSAAEIDRFDEIYGTDTSGIREIGSLDIVAAAAAQSAVRYQPSGGEEVRTALDQLNIDYREYSLIDFGSGKGRVLLVAAEFPFKEVIGIEFSRELHQIASRNIDRLPLEVVRAGRIRTVHGDAAAFEPPDSDLVCYLYNPFGPPVISRVAQRLLAHHRRHGYRVIVIYVDPQYRAAFEGTGMFAILDETAHVLTLATQREPTLPIDNR
jgi:SAM-dependent methyltransferase